MTNRLIILAAGEGSRFKVAGFGEPKPIIKFNNEYLISHAYRAASKFIQFDEVHIPILKCHDLEFDIVNKISSIIPNAIFHLIDNVTSGAAETAALVINKFKSNSGVIVVDCDVAYEIDGYLNLDQLDSDGLLFVFESNLPNYSYAITNGEYISSAVEKIVVSNLAICGVYAFKSSDVFKKAYDEYIITCKLKEKYMSGLVDLLLSKQFSFKFLKINKHISFGTPEELESLKINSI